MVMFAGASVAWLELSLRPLLDQQSITMLEGRPAGTSRRGTQRRCVTAELTRELHTLSQASDLRLTVISPDGEVTADSSVSSDDVSGLDWHGDRPEVVQAVSNQTQGCLVATRAPSGWTWCTSPYRSTGPMAGGILRVSSTTERADTAVMACRLLAVALVGGLGVALFMTWLAASSMNHDLSVLLQHTTTLARGESGAPLKLQHSVELAGLAGSINQMAYEAQRTVRALAEERHRSGIVLQAVQEGLLSIDRERRLTGQPGLRELLGIEASDLGRQIDHALPLPELLTLLELAEAEGTAGRHSAHRLLGTPLRRHPRPPGAHLQRRRLGLRDLGP